jgi:hypothetical protein
MKFLAVALPNCERSARMITGRIHFDNVNPVRSRPEPGYPKHRETGAAHGHFFDFRPVASGPGEPSLISSAHGKISRLLFVIPEYVADPGAELLVKAYDSVFKQLPEYTRVVVLAHPAAQNITEKLLKDNGLDGRAEARTAAAYLPLTVWAEDAYAAANDADGSAWLVEPFVFTRNGDALIADNVSRFTNIKNSQTPLVFQGGNILIGDDFWFLGMDYIAETIQLALGKFPNVGARPPLKLPDDLPSTDKPKERQDALLKFAEGLLGQYLDRKRKLVPVFSRKEIPRSVQKKIKVGGEDWTEVIFDGTGNFQPIFHIDMFLSLAGRDDQGRYQVLVGSPKLAAELLGVTSPPQAMDEIFDDIAQQLADLGFAITRTPLPLVAYDDPDEKVRRWEWATSNNCWVEISQDAKRVYLPTYGYAEFEKLKATDDAIANIWRGLGFEVVQFGDFHPFTIAQGAAHCMKKYLGRTSDVEIG